jgi:hypothetical protein
VLFKSRGSRFGRSPAYSKLKNLLLNCTFELLLLLLLLLLPLVTDHAQAAI